MYRHALRLGMEFVFGAYWKVRGQAEVEDTGSRAEAEDTGFKAEAEDTGFKAEADACPRERPTREARSWDVCP